MQISSKIKNIYYGKEQILTNNKNQPYKTSYKKDPIKPDEIVAVNELGVIGDDQSEKEHHGGIDKAICIYSQKYYLFFKDKFKLNLPDCAFGENITLLDIDDSQICLGDKFKLGEVILEVSQPRQPCYKISAVLGVKNLTALLVKEAKTGFYCRVIKSGNIKLTDKFELISRNYPKFNIEYINKCSYNAKENRENIEEILNCDKISASYKTSLQKRVKNKEQGLQDYQYDL